MTVFFTFFFSISVLPNVTISLPFFICENKTLYFIMFRFFQSNHHFGLSLWLLFANETNNTAIIRTFNV